jgi:ABC-type branched-subunit amino acid transport system ATPase component
MLEVERLTRRFGGLIAVSDVSFEVPDREVTALIGPNGAGKTTLFNTISGVFPPNEGRVRFNGTDITGWPAHKITKLGLGRA